ncbi:MAG: hypothetical protein WCL02_02530 [bacterium]
MLPIDETDKPKVQEWFISNLNKNKDNKMMVLEKISSLLVKNNINLTAKDLEDNLTDFLTGKELIIQDFGIDSFKKISIDSKRVFYLLGECANESLGIQINGIKISTLTTAEAKYTASARPQKEYESNLNFKSHSIAAKPLPQEMKAGIKFHH